MRIAHRITPFVLIAAGVAAQIGSSTLARAGDPAGSTPVFLLAGQSNMEGNVDADLFAALQAELGQGTDADLVDRLIAALHHWYFDVDDGYASYGYSDEIAHFEAIELVAMRDAGLLGPELVATHPNVLCSFNDGAVAPLTTNCGNPFGPELMFGHVLATSGVQQTSLVKVALGGSSLLTDWRPPSSGGTVGPQYLQLQAHIAALASDPASVHPACETEACHWGAFIWFQGENDSFDMANASEYQTDLENLIADVRGEVGSPSLPIIIIQIGGWAQSLDFGPTIAAIQQAVVDADPNARLVVTSDLSGFYHYDPAAQLIIGRRVAAAVEDALGCELLGDCGASTGSDGGSSAGSGDGSADTGAGSGGASSGDGGGITSDGGDATTGADATDTGAADGSSGAVGETPSDAGCGCRSETRPAWSWATLLSVAAVHRRTRRRRRPSNASASTTPTPTDVQATAHAPSQSPKHGAS